MENFEGATKFTNSTVADHWRMNKGSAIAFALSLITPLGLLVSAICVVAGIAPDAPWNPHGPWGATFLVLMASSPLSVIVGLAAMNKRPRKLACYAVIIGALGAIGFFRVLFIM